MKIRVEDNYWEGSCGCCTHFETNLYIDGQEVNQEFCSEEEALGYVLKKYFKVEIEDDPYPASVRPFSEYSNYGENNPPLEPMSNPGDKDYDV